MEGSISVAAPVHAVSDQCKPLSPISDIYVYKMCDFAFAAQTLRFTNSFSAPSGS